MENTKIYIITEKEAKRIKLAMILSIVFIFLNITLTHRPLSLSISSIIVAIILSKVKPAEAKKNKQTTDI